MHRISIQSTLLCMEAMRISPYLACSVAVAGYSVVLVCMWHPLESLVLSICNPMLQARVYAYL